MASETLGIDEWLIATLTGDATLTGLVGARVFTEEAPIGTTFPCVVIRTISTDDQMGAGQNRIMVTEQRLVEGIHQARDFGGLRAIADRIDALLHLKPAAGSVIAGSWSGVTILSSTRLRPSRFIEDIDGRHYRRLGGIFQINAQ